MRKLFQITKSHFVQITNIGSLFQIDYLLTFYYYSFQILTDLKKILKNREATEESIHHTSNDINELVYNVDFEEFSILLKNKT